MRIKSARFITSCADADRSAEYSPQICVAGRSNCGKSTLLNMLMGAKLCKTSRTPGRTRLINVYGVTTDEKPFFFIDLAGYGFSIAQKREADEWNRRTEKYFADNPHIAQALCLMDIRRDPSDLDKTLINYLRDLMLPFTVVLTKCDKLSRAQTGNAVIKISAALGLARDDVIVTSGASGAGKDALLNRLHGAIEAFYTPDEIT